MACEPVGIETRESIVVVDRRVQLFAQIEFPFAEEAVSEGKLGDQCDDECRHIQRPDLRHEPAEADYQHYGAVKREYAIGGRSLI